MNDKNLRQLQKEANRIALELSKAQQKVQALQERYRVAHYACLAEAVRLMDP
jgi:hypothetical protein